MNICWYANQNAEVSLLERGIKMADYNRTVLVGRVAKDLILRYTPKGTAVLDAVIATNERIPIANSENYREEVSYFDVTMWARQAEVMAEYCKKGSQVLIEGRLKQDRWEQDGQKRYKIKVIGERLQLLDRAPTKSTPQQKPATTAPEQPQQTANTVQYATTQPTHSVPTNNPPQDDIPF